MKIYQRYIPEELFIAIASGAAIVATFLAWATGRIGDGRAMLIGIGVVIAITLWRIISVDREHRPEDCWRPRGAPGFDVIQSRNKGFSFVEVMFAVMLLCIGFIMIAGVFPVAISQTQITRNETTASLVGRDAIKEISSISGQVGASALFPAASTVTPLGTNATTAAQIGMNWQSTGDRTFGWVGFYRRPSLADPFAQVFVIVLQNPNFALQNNTAVIPNPVAPVYNGAPAIPPSPVGTAPISPSKTTAQIFFSPSTLNSYAYLSDTSSGSPLPPTFVATGSIILIADDTGTGIAVAGSMIGRAMAVGSQVETVPADCNAPSSLIPAKGSWFQLEPGKDLKDASESMPNGPANVYIVGRAPLRDNAGGFTGALTGPNQDVAEFSGIVSINTANN